jgi:3'-phosphoadenosine 5'-phosphosulfate sulfotransferase (PAPS reductase)/FAD synthetase
MVAPMLITDDAELRIEMTLQGGHKIMREAIETYKPIAIFAGFSGGNDSIVATHFACTEYGAAAVHCNTMIGVEKSREHARKTAARYGWQFIEKFAKPTGPPKFHKKTGLPWDEKVLPNGKWVDGNTKYDRSCIMMVTGVRHDESAIRAGYNRSTKKMGSIVWVNPFYYQTKYDFELYRQEFGLPRNPVTDVIGISGECLCGTMGSPEELDLVEKIEPATKAYVRGIELKCESLGLPCKWATRPPRKCQTDDLQLTLFGDEPEFQPACVGCMRRRVQ